MVLLLLGLRSKWCSSIDSVTEGSFVRGLGAVLPSSEVSSPSGRVTMIHGEVEETWDRTI